jgi:hypothetical protein
MGRQTKLTPNVAQRITTAIEAGAYAREACQAAGIGESTFYLWLERGKAEKARIADAETARDAYKGKSAKRIAQLTAAIDPLPREAPYVDFMEACARATAAAEVQALAVIRAAMGPHTRTRDVTKTEPMPGGKSRTTVERREERVQGDWRAAAWFLERRLPQVYGPRAQVELSGSETGAPVQIVAGDGLDPALAAKAHEFLRAAEEQRRRPALDPGERDPRP